MTRQEDEMSDENYLDFITSENRTRRIESWDIENARSELAQLRATVAAQAEHIVQMADEFSVASICEALGIDDNDDRTPSQIVSDAARLLTQQAERIAWLTSDIGESGLSAINRLIAACERGDGIDQHCAPDLSIARDEILRQAEQLQEAQALIKYVMPSVQPYMVTQLRAWLAANAPQVQTQEEQSA